MSVYDKRVTRDMRQTMLKMHNDLKRIKNTVEECNDMWISDLRRIDEIVHELHKEFEFKPPAKHGAYWSDWMFAEEVPEEDDNE